MIISNNIQDIKLNDKRTCKVSAVNASFKFNMKPEAKTFSIKSKSAIKTKPADEVQHSLAEAGFDSVSDLITLDDISPTTKNISATNIKSGEPIQQTSMQISIDKDADEDLVVIEFNPATGEILDWYQPSAYVIPAENTSAPLVKSMEATAPLTKQQAVFEIPLHVTYSPEPAAYNGLAKRLDLKKKFKKVFKIFSLRKLKKFARNAAAHLWLPMVKRLDQRIVKTECLGAFRAQGAPIKLTDKQKKDMAGKQVLLFVHGIISSTTGAFDEIQADETFYNELSKNYGGNLIAYDHWTLSRDIFENAKDLANELPKNIELDIVCHSRGAGVVRSLLELPKVQKDLKAKNITVRNACFIAGACEGSDIATGRALDNIFKVTTKMAALLGKPAFATVIIAEAIKLIIGGLQELPGTDSMDPKGKFIKILKESKSTLANEYHYYRANYDPSRYSLAALDQAIIDTKIFNGKGNDIIVPFAGAGKSDRYLKGKVTKKVGIDLGSKNSTQTDVWHTTFFENDKVKAGLKKSLF